MLLAARSMGSLNGIGFLSVVASGSLQRPCSRLSDVGTWAAFLSQVLWVMLVQITDAGQAVPPPGM